MLLHRLVGGTTTKFQSFLSYSLKSEWCVDGLTLAKVTRDQGAGNFHPFATWDDERAAAHQLRRLQGQGHAGLGVGAWAAMGHRCTDTKEKYMALTPLLYHLDSEWCTPMYRGTPDLCLAALIPHLLSALADTSCEIFIPTPQLLPVYVSIYLCLWRSTSHNWRSRQQWWQRQPCLIVLSPYRVPTPTAPTEEPEKTKYKPIGDTRETFRENKRLTHLFFRQKSNVGFFEVYKVAKWVDFNEVSKNTSLTPRAASAWVPTLRHGSHKPVWMFHHEENNAFFFSLFSETAMPLKQKCKNKWTKQIQLEADSQHGELQARWLVWQS